MKLKAIRIAATDNWQKPTYGEYVAHCELEGGSYGDAIKVTIDPERCAQIVAIMEVAVVEGMARAAAEFASEMQAKINGPAIEAVGNNRALGDASV